jgi:hypothetical protein
MYEVRVKGGFPLLVSARVCPAEPDVGIMAPYAEIDEITTLTGRSAAWFTDKLTADDWAEIEEQVHEQVFTSHYN